MLEKKGKKYGHSSETVGIIQLYLQDIEPPGCVLHVLADVVSGFRFTVRKCRRVRNPFLPGCHLVFMSSSHLEICRSYSPVTWNLSDTSCKSQTVMRL